MEIVNNVGKEPNIIVFDGKEYELRLNAYVISQFENFNDILSSLGNTETAFKMLTVMMNADIIRKSKGKTVDLLTVEYVEACTGIDDVGVYTKALAGALGFREKTAEEKEIEEALADEDIPETKN